MKNLKVNSCDGIYNSFDVHFTSVCDNNCKHCIDHLLPGKGIKKPNAKAIADTIINNAEGFEDVLFLGGEPCLFLEELIECIKRIKDNTNLKCFITSSVPKTCNDKYNLFAKLMSMVDGFNISAQHYKEDIADKIRNSKSNFDRQSFYKNFPHKEKTRINLNIVKPYLCNKEDILNTLMHYDSLGFPTIRLAELQHCSDKYASFEKIMGVELKSPFTYGCQTKFDVRPFIPNYKGTLILKRSCFLCEKKAKGKFIDLFKIFYKFKHRKDTFNWGVIYEDGTLEKKWI